MPLLYPVQANGLGVRLLSDVGPHGIVIRLSGQQPIEDVLHVDEDIEIISMRTADKRHEIGSTENPQRRCQ